MSLVRAASFRAASGRGPLSSSPPAGAGRSAGTGLPVGSGLSSLLLKESWALVEDQADDLANHLLAQIFLADPDLRDLFPVDLAEHRTRIIDALVTVIHMVDDPERLDEYLRALGRAHRRFHVESEHYELVGAALLECLRTFAGSRWRGDHDQAWRDLIATMTATMTRGADQDANNPPYWHAEVIAHERRGRDVAVFTCQPLQPFDYRAGQYVNLESPYHPRLWRSYSIANAPREDGTLDFHVRAPNHGWVSASLVRRLRIADMVRLGPATGSTVLDPRSNRSIVCVAGGTGLAPIKALVEELARWDPARSDPSRFTSSPRISSPRTSSPWTPSPWTPSPWTASPPTSPRAATLRSSPRQNPARWDSSRRVRVFVGARDRDDLYDLPELLYLAARHSWLSVIPVCSDDPLFPGERGLVHEVMERTGPFPDHDVYVCGPPAMVRATLGCLPRLDVSHRRVRYDPLPSFS